MVARKHACELGASPGPKVMVMTSHIVFDRVMDNGIEYSRDACLNTDGAIASEAVAANVKRLPLAVEGHW